MDAEGRSFVAHQPVGEREEASLWRAAIACPTKSIGNLEQRWEPAGAFPYQLTYGVFALGNNALSSFGAHSYLVARPEGNLMVDSPRFGRRLAESVDGLGGVAHVLLSHRDDVADADRWAERYEARVWIGDADADAAPYATDVTAGDGVTVVSTGAWHRFRHRGTRRGMFCITWTTGCCSRGILSIGTIEGESLTFSLSRRFIRGRRWRIRWTGLLRCR